MSIIVEHNVPLKNLTTLGIGGPASHFVRVGSEDELREAVTFSREENLPLMVLGGGSNILFPDSGVRALVVVPAFTSITYAHAHDNNVLVTVGAGVLLDNFVRETVEKHLWGLENLSHIPGTVGGVPIQNVGAYGVEAKDVVVSVTVYDTEKGVSATLANEACAFGYRTSRFKTNEGKRYIVTSVTFSLSLIPKSRIEYKDLSRRFGEGRGSVSQQDIRDAVIEIRRGKFPDWHVVGTAGSFFKNPIIDTTLYESLVRHYPGIPGFPHHGKVKVSLGWILDHVLHLKGYREGNVGLFEAQALVLVTLGAATAQEVLAFSDDVIQKIFDATQIRVEREVVCIE